MKTDSESQIGTGPFVTASAADSEIDHDGGSRTITEESQTSIAFSWKAYPTVRTAWAAMMRGEVDFLYEVGQDAVEFIQRRILSERVSDSCGAMYTVSSSISKKELSRFGASAVR